MVPAATGSDGGGSIRIPAACCGLVGMKPTRGLVPAPGEPWLGMSVFGALARTVADSALVLSVMSGDPSLARAAEPGRLRIAASRKIPAGLLARLSADQREAWERTRERLSELGHDVIERDPAYRLSSLEFTQAWTRGIYEDSLSIPDRSRLERLSRRMAGAGRIMPAWRRRALLSKRESTTARILKLWSEVDVVLTPGLSRTALPAEGGFGKPVPLAFNLAASFTPWTPVINVTGQPAIAVPAGTGSDGLPLSIQLIGRPGAESVLYALAAQLEAAGPWADRRPPIA
jgi:amidase